MHVVKTIVNRFSLTIKLAVLPYAFKSEKNIPLIGETSVSVNTKLKEAQHEGP
jgi:hypothetical protein